MVLIAPRIAQFFDGQTQSCLPRRRPCLTYQLLVALLVSGVAHQAHADGSRFSMIAQISSDWLYHGTTETDGEPVIGVNAEWQFSEEWFGGVEAHEGKVKNVQQRQRSIMAYLGRGFSLSDDWFLTASLQHREFPGSAKEWDFTEFEVDLLHRSGLGFSVDYSPDYYEHSVQAAATEFRYSEALRGNSYWYAHVGALLLWDNPWFGDDDYQYAQIGAGSSVGAINLDIAYHWNSRGEDEDLAGARFSNPQFMVQVVYKLR